MIADLLEFRRLWRNLTLTPDELRLLQERKLRAVIRHAYDNVPYYRDLLASAGIRPDDIRSLSDLERVPITTKRDLLAAGADRTTRRGFDPNAATPLRTTGSTGEPFAIYREHREIRTRRLVEFRGLVHVGLKPSDRLAVLGATRPHATRLHQRLGLYRSENILPTLPVDEQIRRLERFRPTVLWAYPSPLRAVMERLDFRLHRIVRPRFVISSAEVLHPTFRERIVRDLEVEVYNIYAAMEVGRIAWECRAHQGLHANADAMIVEAVHDGRARAAGYGSVVVTSLDSFTMPMIRYRLGDLASFIGGGCPCGVTLPRIGAPLGRDTDLIILPSGRMVTPLSTGVLMRSLGSTVERWQLTQHARDHLSLSLVPKAPIEPHDLDAFKRSFLAWLGEPVRLEVHIVERVPEIGAKISPFVSEIPGASVAADT